MSKLARSSSSEPSGWAAAVVAAWAIALVVAGGPEEEKPSGVLVETGRADCMRSCASCPGADAHGRGPVADTLRTPPPDLTRIARRARGQAPAGELAAFIDGRTQVSAHGPREMPVWGRLLGEKIAEGVRRDTPAVHHLRLQIAASEESSTRLSFTCLATRAIKTSWFTWSKNFSRSKSTIHRYPAARQDAVSAHPARGDRLAGPRRVRNSHGLIE